MAGNGLCCFVRDSSQQWLVTVSPDSRIHVWNTTSNTLSYSFADKDHLNNAVTSVAGMMKGNTCVIALGTENGALSIYHQAQAVHRGSRHSARVNYLGFSAQGLLYSCSQDSSVIEWSAQGALLRQISNKNPVTCLCLSPDGSKLLIAGAKLKLLDLSSLKTIKKCAGHAAPARCLAFSPDGNYVVSGASDRFVSLWDVKGDKVARNSLHTFSLSSEPTLLTINQYTGANSRLHIGAVARGVGYIWTWTPGSQQGVTGQADCIITPPAPPPSTDGKTKKRKATGLSSAETLGSQTAIVSLAFESESSALVVSGTATHPICQSVPYLTQREITLQVSRTPLIQNKSSSDTGSAPASALTVAAPETIGHVPQSSALDSVVAKPARSRRGKEAPNLGELVSLADKQAVAKSSGGVSTAGSLVVLLRQALQANDQTNLDYCLKEGARSTKVISNTVARLESRLVLSLIRVILARYKARPSRGVFLMPWIREVLTTHTSYLLSVGEAADTLSMLYQCLSSRLVVTKQLQQLNGRLELLMSQASKFSATSSEQVEAVPLSSFGHGAKETPSNGLEEDSAEDEDDSDED